MRERKKERKRNESGLVVLEGDHPGTAPGFTTLGLSIENNYKEKYWERKEEQKKVKREKKVKERKKEEWERPRGVTLGRGRRRRKEKRKWMKERKKERKRRGDRRKEERERPGGHGVGRPWCWRRETTLAPPRASPHLAAALSLKHTALSLYYLQHSSYKVLNIRTKVWIR